jgi:hypothetical protein
MSPAEKQSVKPAKRFRNIDFKNNGVKLSQQFEKGLNPSAYELSFPPVRV